MNATGTEDDMLRLIAVVDHQRRELDRIRAAAASDSVVAMARGALMERLGLSSAEAASQLAELSAATGIALEEMAAAVLAGQLAAPDLTSPDLTAPDLTAPDLTGPDLSGGGLTGPGLTGPGRPGSAPLGGGSAAVTAATRAGRQAPPRPGSLLAETAAELAADGTELAAMLAGQLLAPLGAASVVLWLLGSDGALTLLGEAGLAVGEAPRWQRVPPQLDSPAQRIAHGSGDLWWPGGRPAGDGAPVTGPPGGARAVLGLRQRTGELLGVMETCWAGPLPEFTAETSQRLASLAAGCARVLGARLAHGDLSAAQPKPAVYTLLDSLADSVLVVQAIRDGAGQLTDFSIEHVSPGFRDLAGRGRNDLGRLTLLEAYPSGISGSGLFARAAQVLADGLAQHVPGPLSAALASGLPATGPEPREPADPPAPLAGLRVAPFYDGAIFTWHQDGTGGRLAELGDHAQRLGRLGGFEENLVSGTVRWTDSAFDLFGLSPRPGAEIPLSDLHSYVMAADKLVVQRFRQSLDEHREALTATFRVVHPDDRSIRQIRVFAEPVVDAAGTMVALRGAFQDISAHYHTQVALAATRDQLADSEQRVAEEHLLAVRLQQAIMPPDEKPPEVSGMDVAVRYRPVGEGHLVGGDWYDTLLLPGSQDVLLVVGDVAGHGIDAVTGMVAARNSLRGLAITGAGPAELLRMLNGVMCEMTSGVIGTVVCGRYNPQTHELRWARAGHLPPVLLRGRGARQLPLPGGVLLGMDPEATYEEAVQALAPGDTLLLFTDGLIERRDASIVDVLGDFVAHVAPDPERSGPDRPEPTAAAHADRILASAASDTGDDACLVAVRIR